MCLNCNLICIEWNKKNEVITGCSKGYLMYLKANLKERIFVWKVDSSSIIYLKFSNDEQYLVISTLKGKIYISKWPDMKDIQIVDCLVPTRVSQSAG